MDDLKNKILGEAKALEGELQAWRRELHQHPELGLDLDWTRQFVWDKLVSFGCQPQKCGEGIVVVLGKPGGKTILLRGDMDALPVAEKADVPYKSTNGRMHACGHDMHTSMMLGAAKVLKANEALLEGQVKLMYQPGEETLQGAKNMVDSGVLDDPKVDAAVMIHVMTGLPIPVGMLMIPEGNTGAASSDEFHIVVKGKGGHGAMPHLSIDPINAMAHIHTALQEIHAREIVPGEFLVITPGIFRAGNASNVIADSGEIVGTIRTGASEMVAFAKKRITEISESIAAAFRCTAEVSFCKSCPPMIADVAMSDSARKYMTELLGQLVLPPMGNGSKLGGGSEDFAFVSERVPTIGMFLGVGNSKEGCTYPQHHPKAVFDDSVLFEGTAAYCYLALRWLQENK